MFKLLLAVLLIAAVNSGAVQRGCALRHGTHVRLFGGVDDPDVLVWDSRDRLIAYAGGSSDTRAFLLPHSLLNRPGTGAMVQSCVGGVVHSKFGMDAADAVGILILTGAYRGRYGWVSGLDAHRRAPSDEP